VKKVLFRFCTFIALLFSLSTAHSQSSKTQDATASPQASPEYTYKTTTRLVILDIVATDSKGNIVSDLKPDEIKIFEDDKEQQQHDFAFLHPDPAQATQKIQFHLPPNVYTNAQQFKNNSSYNIILFDVLNTSFPNLAYAHDQLIKYLDSTPANQPTAIFALGSKLWLLHDFTTDREALKESIRKFKGQGSHLVVSSPDQEKSYKRKETFNAGISLDRAWTTLDAFRSLARIMSPYRGRKNLIWISESFVVNTMPDIQAPQGPLFMSDYSREVEETADAMMEAQIAIYPIDAGALSGETFRPMLDRYDAKHSLEEIADRTGGKAFINRNDLDIGIRTSIDDGSSYYTTSYRPANKTWDGKLRKIEVKTTRPGVKLRYRKGYYAVDPTILPTKKKDIKRNIKETSINFAQALDPDLPVSSGLIFQAQVLPPSEKTQNKVVVNFALDPHGVAFTKTEDGLEHAEVSCIAWAFPVKGKPIGSGGGTVKAAVDTKTLDKIMHAAFPCKQSLDLQAGNYMLRLGVIDQATRKIGALTAWVTVPGDLDSAGTRAPEGSGPSLAK
jgi:VWFA-related protein